MAQKQTGKIKAGMGALIGNAGEYYVMAELLKRHVIAGLSPRNAPGFDILATYENKTALIRVKTKTEGYDVWQYSIKKDGIIFRSMKKEGDFTVLVNMAMDVCDIRYFILPTYKVDKWLREIFEEWISKPSRSINNPKRTLSYKNYEKELEPFENNWGILWE